MSVENNYFVDSLLDKTPEEDLAHQIYLEVFKNDFTIPTDMPEKVAADDRADENSQVDKIVTYDSIEIFTINGWKYLKYISQDDNILTLNDHTREYEFKKIISVSCVHYSDIMYHITNKDNINILLHKNQNILLNNSFNTLNSMIVSDFANEFKNNNEDLFNNKFINLDNKFIDFKNCLIKEINYDGNIYHIDVPNNTWLMKIYNNVIWIKN